MFKVSVILLFTLYKKINNSHLATFVFLIFKSFKISFTVVYNEIKVFESNIHVDFDILLSVPSISIHLNIYICTHIQHIT